MVLPAQGHEDHRVVRSAGRGGSRDITWLRLVKTEKGKAAERQRRKARGTKAGRRYVSQLPGIKIKLLYLYWEHPALGRVFFFRAGKDPRFCRGRLTMMIERNRHDLMNPEIAVSVFRYWCLKEGIIPEYATIEQLHRFGNNLLEDGYTRDEVRNCEYVIFNHL